MLCKCFENLRGYCNQYVAASCFHCRRCNGVRVYLNLPTQDRCRRERCKYFHPPQHIKERLVTAGKQFGAMMSTTYVMPTSAFPMPAVSGIEAVSSIALHCLHNVTNSSWFNTQYSCVSLIWQAGLPPVSVMGMNGNVVPSAPPPPPMFYPAPMLSPYGMVTDKLHICPEFMMDQCNVLLCPFVHPGECVCVCVEYACVWVCACSYESVWPLLAWLLAVHASLRAEFSMCMTSRQAGRRGASVWPGS